MPRLNNLRERHHQPYYDTLIREPALVAPTPQVSQITRLFATGRNLGQTEWTNMLAAGQLPSDQSYIVLSLRVHLWFLDASASDMYQLCTNQLYVSLVMGDKPQFASPGWFCPAGGGIHGFDSAAPTLTNGVPSSEAILLFGKPIPMPARQNFFVETTLYDTVNGATVSSLRSTFLNVDTTGSREIKVVIDGLHTRDVQ
jgi:hypothetical protein